MHAARCSMAFFRILHLKYYVLNCTKVLQCFYAWSYIPLAVPCPPSVLTGYRAGGGQSHQIPKREESTDVTLSAAIRCTPKAPI